MIAEPRDGGHGGKARGGVYPGPDWLSVKPGLVPTPPRARATVQVTRGVGGRTGAYGAASTLRQQKSARILWEFGNGQVLVVGKGGREGRAEAEGG